MDYKKDYNRPNFPFDRFARNDPEYRAIGANSNKNCFLTAFRNAAKIFKKDLNYSDEDYEAFCNPRNFPTNIGIPRIYQQDFINDIYNHGYHISRSYYQINLLKNIPFTIDPLDRLFRMVYDNHNQGIYLVTTQTGMEGHAFIIYAHKTPSSILLFKLSREEISNSRRSDSRHESRP